MLDASRIGVDQLMQALVLAYVGALGLCVGSFLNVVIARLPEGQSLVRPRSRCPRCSAAIAWYDNVPIVSYLLLRARCRHCLAPIAIRYPLVELLMGALSLALYVRLGLGWDLARWWPVVAALLAIVFLDIDHWWVPDRITIPAMVWAAATAFLPGGTTPWQALGGLAPAAFVLAFGWVFMKVTGREGIGLGDIKLLVVIGLMLGAWQTLLVLLAGSIQGALVGTVVTLVGGHKGVTSAPIEDDVTVHGVLGGSPLAPLGGEGVGGVGVGSQPNAARHQGDALRRLTASVPRESTAEGLPGDDDWVPPPRAIPFGPFLVLGVLEVLLVPELAELPRSLTALLLPAF